MAENKVFDSEIAILKAVHILEEAIRDVVNSEKTINRLRSKLKKHLMNEKLSPPTENDNTEGIYFMVT